MLYILLGSGFEQAEALVPADLLTRGGIEVALVGLSTPTVSSSHHLTVVPQLTVDQVKLAQGDMLVLPGGLGGVDAMEHDPAAMDLIRSAAADPTVWLCAICAAPTLLARAGLLPKGCRAVCYPGMEGDLVQAGVTPCMDQPFVVEDHLITGRAAGASFDFGLALVEVLAGGETAQQVRAAVHYAP